MRTHRQNRSRTWIVSILSLFLISMLIGACASTAPVKDAAEDTASIFEDTSPKNPAPAAYSGPKLPIAILPMGLSDRAAKRYPHLLDSSVGLGVHNVLTDALYRTGRFRLVEVNESIMKEVMKTQWLSASGAVDKGSAVEIGRMLGAQKVVYGEVYDYSEG